MQIISKDGLISMPIKMHFRGGLPGNRHRRNWACSKQSYQVAARLLCHSRGGVGIDKRKYVFLILSLLKNPLKSRIQCVKILSISIKRLSRFNIILLSSSFASIISGTKFKGEKFLLASAVTCTF